MSDSDHKRAQRVGELIQHELAGVIINELKDPRVGFVTVTEVRVSGDLRSARVFVSIFGTPEERAASLDGLRAAAGYLRHVLGDRLDLRWVPDLSFECDETLDQAARLDSIMQAIAKGETETPPPEPAPMVEARTYRSELADKRRTFTEAEDRKQAQAQEPRAQQPQAGRAAGETSGGDTSGGRVSEGKMTKRAGDGGRRPRSRPQRQNPRSRPRR